MGCEQFPARVRDLTVQAFRSAKAAALVTDLVRQAEAQVSRALTLGGWPRMERLREIRLARPESVGDQ
jgi:hypothetical protein